MQWTALLGKIVTGQGLVFSPNLIWFSIAVLNYLVFPYDFDKVIPYPPLRVSLVFTRSHSHCIVTTPLTT